MIWALFDADGFLVRFYDAFEFPPIVGADGAVTRNPAIPAEAVTVGEADRARICGRPRGWRWDGGAVVAVAVPEPVRTPTVTGNQWFFALADLGLSALWRKAKAVSKDKDQNRVDLIARDTPLLATDPLLLRVCANAGQNPDGSSVIDPAQVFARALTEPT